MWLKTGDYGNGFQGAGFFNGFTSQKATEASLEPENEADFAVNDLIMAVDAMQSCCDSMVQSMGARTINIGFL